MKKILKTINFFTISPFNDDPSSPLKSSQSRFLSPSSFNVFTQCHVTVYTLLFRSRLKWPDIACLALIMAYSPPSRIDQTLMMIRYRFCVNGYRHRISNKTYWITETSSMVPRNRTRPYLLSREDDTSELN